VQVSARLNYGNNGGPIIDLDGRCVALAAHCTHDATDLDARKGFNSGVGFATPADRLRALLPRLRAGETLPARETPFLGVGALGPDPRGEGVRVGQIVPGTPAAGAGLRVGDVLVVAGETQVESDLDLRFAIDERDPGDALDLVVLRGPERTRVELSVTLGARPRAARQR
jgi:putative serine protease PepD